MKIWLQLLPLLILLTGCASPRGSYQGEHLVIPFVDALQQWQLFQKADDSFRSNMWQKPGERWADTYAVSIYYKQFHNLELKRQEMDAPGKQHCQTFESNVLAHPKQGEMQSLFWRTQCKLENKVVAEMLHLMIQGQESYYQIQKIWKFDVDDSEFTLWQARFEDTFVCHQGPQESTCPSLDD
ncbi:hypothetical protein [Aliiglaciecola litoralis]|uniref:Lipoprotein n=1 Tax=Aliiglaciecola litoralis TaxID=582857 RepID=A0ABN1LGY0_9ALTE